MPETLPVGTEQIPNEPASVQTGERLVDVSTGDDLNNPITSEQMSRPVVENMIDNLSIIEPIQESDKKPIKLVIVGQSSDAVDSARDFADRRLDRELNEGSGFKRFLNGIWKGNIVKDYYRNKYIAEARSVIESSQDVLILDADADARKRAKESTIERYQSECDEVIHTDAGEKREVQTSDSELSVSMKQLIGRYCKGELNDETLVEERTRLLNAYCETHGTESSLGRGIVVVDNMLEVAKAVSNAIEHGESLDNVLNNIQIISGEAHNGVRTEARHNKVEKAIEKLSETKIGSLVGPEVVAATVTMITSLTRVGSKSVIGAAMKTLLPGVAAGAWAGLRENRRLKDERAQHSREMAQGKEFNPGDERRTEMEQTRYESISANDLTEHIRSISAKEKLDEGGAEALQVALDSLAAIEARIKLSDKRKIDLLTFSNTAAIGDERMALDIARAEAKVALTARLSSDMRRELGLEEEVDLSEIINGQSESFIELLDEDIDNKDQTFKKLRNRRVAKAAAVGVVTGLTFGLIAQEGIAAFDSTRDGLIEQLWHADNTALHGVEHQTVLHGMFAGNHSVEADGSDSATHTFGANGEISTYGGNQIVENNDSTFSLVDQSGQTQIENVAINTDGSLPPESIARLEQFGMVVNDKSFDTEVVTTQVKEVGVSEFVQKHLAETTHIVRDMWYDNNTVGKFDLNELRLHWSGNDGIAGNGYQMSVSSMMDNGSFHGNQSVDWSEAARTGELKLAISASVDTQTHVFMVDIGPDGQINIPADSPAGQFFENNGGSAEFHGAYAEVVQIMGAEPDGSEHVRPLATLVGDRSATSVFDKVPTTVIEHHHNYEIFNKQTEMAPIIPIISRKSMETLKSNKGNEYYYRGSEYLSPAEIELIRGETSPRLVENPESDLVLGDELDWYKEMLDKKFGEEYVKEVEGAIAKTPELSNLSSEIEAIVKIPVNAAGKAESENIYNVLTKAYGQQDKEALDKTVILLHVNWFDRYDGANEDESAMRANIEHTKAEIERAKADCPNLKIAVIETEWKRSEVRHGVIGHVSRKMNDVALLALQLAISGGRMERDHEVLLIRNDADPKGLAVHYLKRFIDSFNVNNQTDVFKGTTSFDNTKASRLPGFVFAANFMQSLDLIAASREHNCHTGGANFGVRASTFAAIGAIGFNKNNSGTGTDDVVIGRRIKAARGGKLLNTRQKIIEYVSRSYVHRDSEINRPKRIISKKVYGARVDTDSDRGEELYENGIPILNQWNSEFEFSKNGYKQRNANVDSSMKESVVGNPEEVIERIRNDMEGTINGMGMSKSVIETALAFTFPSIGRRAYKLTTDQSGYQNFEITNEGKEYLKKYLTRDSKGRMDPYGNRKLRQIYGEQIPGSKRAPNGRSMIRV